MKEARRGSKGKDQNPHHVYLNPLDQLVVRLGFMLPGPSSLCVQDTDIQSKSKHLVLWRKGFQL